MSTLSAIQTLPRLRVSTPTAKIDYVAPKGPDESEPAALLRNFPNRFKVTERKIFELETWPDGWDGYDAPKPDPISIGRARSWAEQLYRDFSAESWINPHISADDGGEVSLEWWKGRKKLTVYISPRAIEYIKVEKTDASPRMEDGLIETPEKRRELWNWLTN
jgi:hypothetical protein